MKNDKRRLSVKEAVSQEIRRLARTLHEGMQDPEMILPSRVESILFRVHEDLYPKVDALEETIPRRKLMEELDRVVYAAERFLEGCDTAALDECVADATTMLSPLLESASLGAFKRIVTEEVSLSRLRRALFEAPDVQPGNVRELDNDSVDVALDSYFEKAGETLGASGEANKEPSEDGDGEQKFSAMDFASDVATLIDRVSTLIDLEGTVARRAYNHVSKKYGAEAAENVKQALVANFHIDLQPEHDSEAERDEDRPAAVGAGGSGGAIGGGAAGGGGPP